MLIKHHEEMINGTIFFDQSVKVTIAYTEITNVNDVPAGCLLDYPYSLEHYKLITTDLTKQQCFDADSKIAQQIT